MTEPSDDKKPEDKLVDKPTDDITPPTDDKTGEDEQVVEKTDEEKKAEAEAAEAKETELKLTETPEETEARHTKEEADKVATEAAKVDDTPKYATKEDIKDALAERESETQQHFSKVSEAKAKIIDILHPEGIDQKIYDTDGKVIQTAQDIVDRGLINERTGEAYTYDEAASFMLQVQQKMAQNVKELEDWAEKTGEKNIDLLEGNDRVLAKWGDVLKTLSKETVEKLAAKYVQTQVKFDKTNQYVLEMNQTPEDWYSTVLAPYSDLRASISTEQQAKADADAKAAKEAQEAKEAEELADQEERNGTPPRRGTSNTKSATGDPMLDALVDELNKD
jgi:hypothetical protein